MKKWKNLRGKMSTQRQLLNTLRAEMLWSRHEKWKDTIIESVVLNGCEVTVNGEVEIFMNEDDAQTFVEGLQYQGILRQFTKE